MGVNELDELLKRMPDIAKAVNAFTSEAVQERAFATLVGSFGSDDAGEDADEQRETGAESPTPGATPPRKSRAAKKAASRTSKAASSGRKHTGSAPKMVHDLNLRPSGKDSLKKFAAEKAPKSQDEKNAVILYYLKEVLGIAKVTADHVFTAYREMKDEGWKTPSNVRNSLQVTKSTKGWVDTSDMDDISMPIAGTNMVEHDLPKATTK